MCDFFSSSSSSIDKDLLALAGGKEEAKKRVLKLDWEASDCAHDCVCRNI